MANKETFPSDVSSETLQLKPQELEVISDPSLNIGNEVVEIPNVIYGRMLSGRSVNKKGLKNLFESLWQSKASVKIEDYTEGIVTLTFESEVVKNRILRGQPWHFAGSYLILMEANAMVQITTTELLQQIPFWVQVHGLPLGFLVKPLGERLGKKIANSMGQFMEFDPNYQRNLMRFRVLLDTSKPLQRGKFLGLDKQKDNMWVSFRYEKLTKFCYFCGNLDHILKDCAGFMEELEGGNKPTLQYKESLKAVSLTYPTFPEANVVQGSSKKSFGQIVVEAGQIYPKFSDMEPNAKRQKLGNTNEVSNISKQKDDIEEVNNKNPLVPKGSSKGLRVNSPVQKLAGYDQKESSRQSGSEKCVKDRKFGDYNKGLNKEDYVLGVGL
ncbi:hypothetical protein POM88_007740 [Heracleum sosnowskyi]|uniref:CCHC-type domain-containing protein n=1 Tax=Heracleum sosnowskyi TaxID=360622 RepID=A0AAD8N6K7_9APIA|nr:hypothetical protein POM88_007740 [Heracleum sosnowskyi]